MNKAVRAVKDAGSVVVGKGIARGLPKLVNLPTVGIMGVAVQALTGIIVGPIVARFAAPILGRDAERFIMAGALLAPIESIVAGLPVIGPMLGEYDYLAAIPQDLSPVDLIGEGTDDVLAAYTEDAMGGYLSPAF